MKTQYATTKLQSLWLKNLGLRDNSADMCYYLDYHKSLPYKEMIQYADKSLIESVVPSWSIAALEALVPKTIKLGGSNFSLKIRWENSFNGWVIKYDVWDFSPIIEPTLIEGYVALVEWLLKNGYQLNYE